MGSDTAAQAPALLMELPAADLNALWLLLETLSRVAANAAVNEMAAHDLARIFAGILAWFPPPKPDAQVGGAAAPCSCSPDKLQLQSLSATGHHLKHCKSEVGRCWCTYGVRLS